MQQQPGPNAHWRDSARSSRLFIFNSSAAFPLLIFLFHIRLWTFGLAIATMLFFTVIERYGFSVIVFLRLLRGFLAGRHKISNPWWM